MTATARPSGSAAYLIGRLAVLEGRVRRLVTERRAHDANPDDPFRGLYLSDDHIDRILDEPGGRPGPDWDDTGALADLDAAASRSEEDGAPVVLRRLAERVGLDDVDVDILLVALAPDLDSRFERLYGYLNDDVTRRRATIGLAVELVGTSPWSAATRGRLAGTGRLVRAGLVEIEDADRPFLSRGLRVPDRVTAHLLGNDEIDPAIASLLSPSIIREGDPRATAVARVLSAGARLAYLREAAGASAAVVAATACTEAGWRPLVFDLRQMGADDDVARLARLMWREGLLLGGAVVVGPVDALPDRDNTAATALASAGGAAPPGRSAQHEPVEDAVPFVLFGRRPWDPYWSRQVPLTAEVAAEAPTDRIRFWRERLETVGAGDLASGEAVAQFLLAPDQVDRAVVAALLQSMLDGGELAVEHLRAGARAQNGAGLERLARRIHPRVTWADLVLAPDTEESLRALSTRARQRTRVLDEWGLRPGGARGRGITVLFAGDSGTGKTMSAEVIAADLGLDLYTINLATVVDKYVGETEKNLERIFSEADGVNAVLLFDEADAIFGKRSEVKDANDRYANIEVAYLLQRMETFDGIAILATNLRANVDEAFSRRLDLIIDFPAPDPGLRRALWERCLPPAVPRSDELDLDYCAQAFELSGGNIRSAAITAAYAAADLDRPVGMNDLVRAIAEEYRKLGRLVVQREFGPYFELVARS